MTRTRTRTLTREIKTTQRTTDTNLAPLPGLDKTETDLRAWLAKRAWPGAQWLLAHTLSGVVWGRLIRDADAPTVTADTPTEDTPTEAAAQLVLGSDIAAFASSVRGRLIPAQLESCHLFGPDGELFVWRDDDGLRARLYRDYPAAVGPADVDEAAVDGAGEECDYFDEPHLLWGTQAEPEGEQEGFTLVSDGVQGFRQAVPWTDIPFDPIQAAQKQRPLRLWVRHYLGRDPQDGTVTIAGSRLLRLDTARITVERSGSKRD